MAHDGKSFPVGKRPEINDTFFCCPFFPHHDYLFGSLLKLSSAVHHYYVRFLTWWVSLQFGHCELFHLRASYWDILCWIRFVSVTAHTVAIYPHISFTFSFEAPVMYCLLAGFKLTLFIDANEYIGHLADSVGAVVSLHSPYLQSRNLDNSPIFVSPGTAVSVALTVVRAIHHLINSL